MAVDWCSLSAAFRFISDRLSGNLACGGSGMSTGARTGTAQLPLHYGAAPRWLFERMTGLGRREKLEALRRLAAV